VCFASEPAVEQHVAFRVTEYPRALTGRGWVGLCAQGVRVAAWASGRVVSSRAEAFGVFGVEAVACDKAEDGGES
jgi:hypothetical protein